MSSDSMMAGCFIKNARIVIAVCSGRLVHGGRAGEAGRDGVVQAGGEGVGLGAGRSLGGLSAAREIMMKATCIVGSIVDP
jgi:hypothetical protein